MKRKQTLTIAGVILLLVILAGPLTASRQHSCNPPIPAAGADSVLVEWQFLLETPTLFDVWARIVHCNGQNVVEMRLINENPKEQSVSVDITVTGNEESVLVQKSYTVTYPGGKFMEANCRENREPGFMFVIPGKEDPKKLKMKAAVNNPTK